MTHDAMVRERRPIRVLIAKPGLDGHDVGAKVVCRALADAGMVVVYTGLRKSPQQIAEAAARENVDAVGLSVLAGAHVLLVRRVMEEFERVGMGNKVVLVGGNVPKRDHEALKALGVAAVFPTGTPFDTITRFLEQAER